MVLNIVRIAVAIVIPRRLGERRLIPKLGHLLNVTSGLPSPLLPIARGLSRYQPCMSDTKFLARNSKVGTGYSM